MKKIFSTNFQNFYKQVSKITLIVLNKDLGNQRVPQYFKEFSSFYDTWLLNKYIGGGVKNFRFADPVFHEDLFKLAEKYIRNIDKVDLVKYSFLLKLFDKAEIININEL